MVEMDAKYGNYELVIEERAGRVQPDVKIIVDDRVITRYVATEHMTKMNPYYNDIHAEGGFGKMRVRVKLESVVDVIKIISHKQSGERVYHETRYKLHR